ncbi:MAG: ADP-forming succinate--CoA ligase subunit beta [Chloroflexi bacterium]|nr:ADP-forming succinate--CoA ligase subunit beta [Chloroflexota bacterium]
MRLYEFQAKQIFAANGIPVPEGAIASSPDEATAAASKIGKSVALKAQVLAGSRGKAGGVRFADTPATAFDISQAMFGTSIDGLGVRQLLVEEKLAISRELYLGFAMDRSRQCPVAIFCPTGGMEIEEIARTAPDQVVVCPIDSSNGFYAYHAIGMLARGGLRQKQLTTVAGLAAKLYRVYRDLDAELVEINPLAVCESSEIVAADGRIAIDDNALSRQKDLPKNVMPGTPLETEAQEAGLTYVELDGDICVLANGAGLTLATMDLISACGGRPANFIEVGGGAYVKARRALQIALAHEGLKALFVNVFGAFARTDVIADGFTTALAELKPSLPIVVCIRGTEEEAARELVRQRLGIISHTEMEEAAREVVARAYAS